MINMDSAALSLGFKQVGTLALWNSKRHVTTVRQTMITLTILDISAYLENYSSGLLGLRTGLFNFFPERRAGCLILIVYQPQFVQKSNVTARLVTAG